ncbi:hypothetical protein FRB90_010613 [Tulasnella sp. 427]|nr:hypothetical protein FRB90_010613 [Tulasnella sp. 427]
MPDNLGGSIQNLNSQISININGFPYKKHTNHWYEDGNIIVLVEDVAFRVFRSFLARHGNILESATITYGPTEPSTGAEGYSILKLSDIATRFEALLDVLLPPTGAGPPISTKSPSRRLMGLVQISKKYGLIEISAQAVALLDQVLPTLEQPHRSIRRPTAARVIRWARDCELPQFLPLAFYYLATGECDLGGAQTDKTRKLSADDRLRVQQGLIRLQTMVIRLALTRWENNPIGDLKPKISCPAKRLDCWVGYGGKVWPKGMDGARWTNLLLHPLEELQMRACCEVASVRQLCPKCREELGMANTLMITDILKELKSLFSLE